MPQSFEVPAWSHWLLFGGLLSVGIGRSVTLAVLAPIGRELGLMEIQVGLISALTAAMFFFGGPFWGRRCESMGRRKVMIIGLIGYAITTLMFAAWSKPECMGLLPLLIVYPLMLLTRMSFAAVASGVFPASQSFVAVTTRPGRTHRGHCAAECRLWAWINIGSGGWRRHGADQPDRAALCGGVGGAVSAVLIWLFLPEPPTRVTPPGVRSCALPIRASGLI